MNNVAKIISFLIVNFLSKNNMSSILSKLSKPKNLKLRSQIKTYLVEKNDFVKIDDLRIDLLVKNTDNLMENLELLNVLKIVEFCGNEVKIN